MHKINLKDIERIGSLLECLGDAAKQNYIEENERDSTSLWTLLLKHRQEFEEIKMCFFISTLARGSRRGKEYLFKAKTAEDMQMWLAVIDKIRSTSQAKENMLSKTRKYCRWLYTSKPFEITVAVMIYINFGVIVLEKQMLPGPDSELEVVISTFYTILTILFALELLLNFYVTKFSVFYRDYWNWFDTVIVATSLLSLSSDGDPAMKLFRLARVFRIFRMLRTVRSLNKLVAALHQSLPAVMNAFLLVLLVCCMYSIVCTRIFGGPNFSDFGTAMFTFWMLITFDNACSTIQSVFSNFSSDAEILGLCLFFITFQLLVGYILINIVMAVLLDEFTASSRRAREQQLQEARRATAAQRAGPLDVLLEWLATVEPRAAVEQELQAMFELIDEDGSGSIDLAELQQGLTQMEMLGGSREEGEEDLAALMRRRGLHRDTRLSFHDFWELVREELSIFELRAIDQARSPAPALVTLSCVYINRYVSVNR